MDQQTREQFFHQRRGHRAFRAAIGARRHDRRDGGPRLHLSRHGVQLADRVRVHRPSRELRLTPFVAAVLPALFVLGELTFVALLRDCLPEHRVPASDSRRCTAAIEDSFPRPIYDPPWPGPGDHIGDGDRRPAPRGSGAAVHRRQHHRGRQQYPRRHQPGAAPREHDRARQGHRHGGRRARRRAAVRPAPGLRTLARRRCRPTSSHYSYLLVTADRLHPAAPPARPPMQATGHAAKTSSSESGRK